MNDVGGFLMLMALTLLVFICFVIYFVFKMLEFVIRAINLYEKMVNRQDAIIKLLMQVRNAVSGDQVAQTEPEPLAVLQKLEAVGEPQSLHTENKSVLYKGSTAIHKAASSNNVEALKSLLDAGTDIELEFRNESPLDVAVECGHLDAVRLLVERGARIAHSALGHNHIKRAKCLEHADIANFLSQELQKRSS